MKVSEQVSQNIIDRRRGAWTGAIAGVIATLLAVLGFRGFVTGSSKDPERDMVFVVSTALDRGQTYWAGKFQPGQYRPAKVVIFERATGSGCGRALSESGPFFCPADERIYIDLTWLRAIPSEFGRAYVVFHELGHHVQKLTGRDLVGGFSVELQADCLAGEVMRSEMLGGYLEPGDIAAALAQAAAVGDDVVRPSAPETWTHGTADMRVGAVRAGIEGRSCL